MINPWKISTFAFATAFVVTVGGSFVMPAHAHARTKMHEALDHLRQARNEIESNEEVEGHRKIALIKTDEAIAEVKASVDWYDRH